MNVAVLGHNDVILVKIDSDEPVSELKNKIIDATRATASFYPSELTLYKVNIYVPEDAFDEVYKSITLCTIDFKRENKLGNPLCKLSSIPDGFPEGNIHILVEVPAGESFSPRPGRDVAEIVLSLTTPTLQRPRLSLADRPSLSNHSLIVQHRPQRCPYA